MKSLDASFIKSKINISDIISKYVSLSISGRQIKGLCPFHEEKTPSFFVDLSKQKYHCFGCGADGDVINFVMEINRVSFQEAIVLLARESGIDLEVAKNDAFTDKAKHHLNLISKFFEAQLVSNKIASEYIYFSRKFTKDIVKKFRIGYCPKSICDLENFIDRNCLDKDLLINLGILFFVKKNNKFFCPFYGRVIFPIFNKQNQVIAFGARKIDANLPGAKYINSKESKIFIKKSCLYGIYSKTFLPEDCKSAILVEGYTDVIALTQNNIDGVFASMGTSVGEEQLIALWCKLGYKEISICFDGDKAGETAMLKIAKIALGILQPGKEMFFLKLRDNLDPCSVVEKSKLDFNALIEQRISLCDFLLSNFFSNLDISIPERASFVRKKIENMTSLIKDKLLREEYKKFFERKLSLLSEEPIYNKFEKNFSSNFFDKKKCFSEKKEVSFKGNTHSKKLMDSINEITNLISKIEISIACTFPSIFCVAETAEEFAFIVAKSSILVDAKQLILKIIEESDEIGIVDLKNILIKHFGDKISPFFVNISSYGMFSKDIAIKKYAKLKKLYSEISLYEHEIKKIFNSFYKIDKENYEISLFEELIRVQRNVSEVYKKLRTFC